MTRQFPSPGNLFKQVWNENHSRRLDVRVSEIDRRQNHISIVAQNHPLKLIALDCLKDEDDERPSARQACKRVAALKESADYSESVKANEERISGDEKDRELSVLREQHAQQIEDLQRTIQSQLEEKEKLIKERDETIANIVLQKDKVILDRDQKMAAEQKEMKLQLQLLREYIRQLQQDLKDRDEMIAEREQVIQSHTDNLLEKDQTISTLEEQNQQCTEQIKDLQLVTQKQRKLLEEKDQRITQLNMVIDECISGWDDMSKPQLKLEHFHREDIQQLEQTVIQKDGEIEQRVRQLNCLEERLAESEQLTAEFQRRVDELELQCSLREQPGTQHSEEARGRANSRLSIKLRWREDKKAPHRMSSYFNAAVDDSNIYIRLNGNEIYAYTVKSSAWSQLPPCPNTHCPSVVINNLLTNIGGRFRGNITNKLFTLTGSSWGWIEEFPPMPSERTDATAVCAGTVLIVAGGKGNRSRELTTVEMMNTDNRQWSTAASLPIPMYSASMTVCGDHIYVLERWQKSVYTCSTSALLQSCQTSRSPQKYLARSVSLSNEASVRIPVWKRVSTALPVTHSTCVSLHGQLLAVGGEDSDRNPTTAVYEYNPTARSWEVVSHMSIARYKCLVPVLSNNQLMVVGGCVDKNGTETDTVELATAAVVQELC